MRLSSLPGRFGRLFARALRRLRRIESRVVRLPSATTPAVGHVLLSYVVDPFLVASEAEISYAHTQDWECFAIAGTLRTLGFEVDVVHWTNRTFVPDRTYDLLIDPRSNLERLAPLAGADCLRIFHAETAHWSVSDAAQLARLDQLAARRGQRLTRTRLVGENRGIESADCAVVLGNDWTLDSYRRFGKPLWRVPLSNALLYPSPAGKKFDAARGRFLWFGGVGFVHKGLDLALEAFAGVEGLALEVAAPLDREPDFAALYRRELFETPNIRALGWLDVASERFREVAARSTGFVFPSCSEGGGGSAITTMHAGLIPVVTREASVDVGPAEGVVLADASVETIRAACLDLSRRPAAELEAMAVATWERVRAEHTRERFRANYREAILDLLERFRPALRAKIAA